VRSSSSSSSSSSRRRRGRGSSSSKQSVSRYIEVDSTAIFLVCDMQRQQQAHRLQRGAENSSKKHA
jgi:hypothetical protein